MPDEQDQPQPIIIKKVYGGHGGHHGGSWKVAFADFMTAMMAFFLVLWLVGQEQDIKSAVAGYFSDPVGFDRGGKIGAGEGAGMFKSGKGVMDKTTAMSIVRKKLKQAAEKILSNLKLSDQFEGMRDDILVEITPEGLRIQLIERSDSSFFEPGRARMRPTGEAILGLVAQELVKLPNRMVFEGHTDASGAANVYGYGNWDLGADRANYCRKVMMRNGARTSQIREVRSYADTQPLKPEDPYDPMNRRVAILMLNDYDYLLKNKLVPGAEDLSVDSPGAAGTVNGDNPLLDSSSETSVKGAEENAPDEINEENFEIPGYLQEDGNR